MNKSLFRFKQFVVDQQGSAMKINTDGVLLAAKVSVISPQYILDIGTGTGVIALMLAQRFPDAQVHALEINEEAAKCAKKNFENSSFAERLTLYFIDFKDFKPSINYDLIVSNPPFFINSLKGPNQNKALARHAQEEFFVNLFTLTFDWLAANGTFQLIWPVALSDLSKEKGFLSAWTVQHQLLIRSFENSAAIRVISTLGKQKGDLQTQSFVIYESKGKYTEEYLDLLNPFFLNF